MGGQGVRWTVSPMDRLDKELFSSGVRMTRSYVEKELVEGVGCEGKLGGREELGEQLGQGANGSGS